MSFRLVHKKDFDPGHSSVKTGAGRVCEGLSVRTGKVQDTVLPTRGDPDGAEGVREEGWKVQDHTPTTVGTETSDVLDRAYTGELSHKQGSGHKGN